MPIPPSLFECAQRLQSLYNVQYARIAMDGDFLGEVMTVNGVGKIDESVGRF